MSGRRDDDAGELSLPEALTDALRRSDEPRTTVPEAVDRALRERARLVVRRRPGLVRRAGRVAAVAAAAAALVLVFVPLADLPAPEVRSPRMETAAPGEQAQARVDVDASGRVDVLDAFLLARALRDGVTRPEYDVDGNGSFDADDVGVVVSAAVSLEEAR